MKCLFGTVVVLIPLVASAQVLPPSISLSLKQSCIDCHNKETTEGGLDLTALSSLRRSPPF